MTDREPDDLYDALRKRLADHGQEPPAPLWASIRAQLPPPVAQPQLRRRRRWAPAALLLLLLTVAAGTGWQWWHAQPGEGNGQLATWTKSQNITDNQILTSPTPQHRAIASNKAAASAQSSGSAAISEAASATAENTLSNTAQSAAANLARGSSASGPGKAGNEAASGATARPQAGIAALTKPLKPKAETRRGAYPSGGTAASAQSAAVTAASGSAAAGAGMLAHQQKPIDSQTATSTSETSAASDPVLAASAQQSAAQTVESSQNGAQITMSATALANPTETLENTPAGRNGRPAQASRHTARQPGLSPITASATARSEAVAALQAQLVALGLPTWPALPAPQLVAVAPSTLPVPFVGRWAVQVLAGPALTYRRLSSAPQISPANASPIAGNPNAMADLLSGTAIAPLERPALSGGAQVSVRRTISKHWNVSAGLGYTEYASALALKQVRTATNNFVLGQDSSGSTGIHRRDTYRFVTIPVRVGYGWTLSGRWRVGVQAGADAAIYVGGSTTEGSPCACQTQSWGPTGSPYRSLSMGLSLGADVRYRLSSRWELLAQPTASYLVTPLARSSASATYYERHLFGGAALLGVSFDLP